MAKSPTKLGIQPIGSPVVTTVGQDQLKNELSAWDAFYATPAGKKQTAVNAARQAQIKQANSVNQYLTNDTTYQQQTAAINSALSNYKAQELDSENQEQSQYGQNVYDLQAANDQAASDQADDYASRGIYRSGLYAKADSDRLNQNASKQSQLDMDKSNFLTNARASLGTYTQSQALAQQQARQDAINRRALGLITGPTGVV